MVFAAAVNRGLGSRTGAGRVLRELPTEPGPPRALKPPFSRSREKGRFHHGLLGPSAQGGIFATENISEERNGSGMDISTGKDLGNGNSSRCGRRAKRI